MPMRWICPWTTDTGEVTIHSYVVAQDVGFAINPTYIEGQIEGGVAQGLGQTLSEEIVYRDGRVLNANLTDYKMPTALDVPASSRSSSSTRASSGRTAPRASASLRTSSRRRRSPMPSPRRSACGSRRLPITAERICTARGQIEPMIAVRVRMNGYLRQFMPGGASTMELSLTDGTRGMELLSMLGAGPDVWLMAVNGTAVPMDCVLASGDRGRLLAGDGGWLRWRRGRARRREPPKEQPRAIEARRSSAHWRCWRPSTIRTPSSASASWPECCRWIARWFTGLSRRSKRASSSSRTRQRAAIASARRPS